MQVIFHLAGITFLLLVGIGCDYYITQRLVIPRYGRRGMLIHMMLHATLLAPLTVIGCIAAVGGLEDSIPVLVWVMYGFMLLYVPKICYTAISWIDYIKHPRGCLGHYMGISIAVLSLVFIVSGTINRYRIHTSTCHITSERLPECFDNYRIVHFSDMHLETLYSHEYAQQVVDCINNLSPDIIVFSGDMVNRKATELEEYYPYFSQLRANDGIFVVMGNHDYGDFVKWSSPVAHEVNLSHLHALYTQMGWKLLNNNSTYIHKGNNSIAVIGVENWGEPPFPQYGNLSQAYPSLQDNHFKILISHNPRHWRHVVIHDSNIDLTLSGHTHALQMQIGNFSPASLRYPEWGGLYSEGNQHLYVNVGIGCTMFPIRIGATPEVSLITLHSVQ